MFGFLAFPISYMLEVCTLHITAYFLCCLGKYFSLWVFVASGDVFSSTYSQFRSFSISQYLSYDIWYCAKHNLCNLIQSRNLTQPSLMLVTYFIISPSLTSYWHHGKAWYIFLSHSLSTKITLFPPFHPEVWVQAGALVLRPPCIVGLIPPEDH